MADTNMNSAANVGVGKPKVTGAIWVAPKGTTLPTSASATIGAAFKCMGYISEDGVVIGESRDNEKVKAWGGDVVRNSQTSYEKTLKFTPIECNETVLKTRFGSSNVSGSDSTGWTIKHNSKELEHCAWVIDTIPAEGYIERYCIEDGQPADPEDITLNDSDPIGYGMTVNTFPGSDGDYMKQYRAKIAAA